MPSLRQSPTLRQNAQKRSKIDDFSTIFDESGNFEKRLAVAVPDIVDLSTIFVSNPHWAVDGAMSDVGLTFLYPDTVGSNGRDDFSNRGIMLPILARVPYATSLRCGVRTRTLRVRFGSSGSGFARKAWQNSIEREKSHQQWRNTTVRITIRGHFLEQLFSNSLPTTQISVAENGVSSIPKPKGITYKMLQKRRFSMVCLALPSEATPPPGSPQDFSIFLRYWT